jgi:hypothetical protein
VIREFPKELLKGMCKIFSFSALMSSERRKHPGICSLDGSIDGRLPLIYEIMNIAIKKGAVKSPVEFIQRYLISEVFNALEPIVFEEGLSVALHGQNLCMVFDNDHLPIGFAIRDHGDIHRVNRYLETYTWFYRYHVFIKLLNVITASDNYHLPPAPGAPIQIGHAKPLKERSLNSYFHSQAMAEPTLKKLSITFEEYKTLLSQLDEKYLSLLSTYFDLKDIELVDGSLPSAEIGSAAERPSFNRMLHINSMFYKLY